MRMIPILKCRLFQVALLSACVALVPDPDWAESLRQVEPSRDLEGLTAIRLQIDGITKPIGKSAVSEATIRQVVTQQLEQVGLRVIQSPLVTAPTLSLRVLAPMHDSEYFYVITLGLVERCTTARKPNREILFCNTWSIYPRIGFFSTGEESRLIATATDAVKQFIDAWSADRRRPDV